MYDTDAMPDAGPTEGQALDWAIHNDHVDGQEPDDHDEPGVEPDWPPAPATITLAWETRERYEAELTPAAARGIFGLVGTPDKHLRSRIALLLQHGHGFDALHPCGLHQGTYGHKLTQIDGQDPKDI